MYKKISAVLLGSFGCLLVLLSLLVKDRQAIVSTIADTSRYIHNIPGHQDGPQFDLPTSRKSYDGRWYSREKPLKIVAYSAFYDTRLENHSVRIILVSEILRTWPPFPIFCGFPTSPNSSSRLESVKGLLGPIGMGVRTSESFFREFILTCSVPRGSRPKTVSVMVSSEERESTLIIPIENFSTNVPSRQEHAVCVSVSYGKHDTLAIVEWMEMQKILGASKVTIYNNSLDAEAGRVFQFYRDEGFVELRQSHNFLSEKNVPAIMLHMSPVINDCLYRNMYHYRSISVIDLDELILPRSHKDIPSMWHSLDQSLKAHEARSFIFRNAYFFLNWPADPSQPAGLRYLQFRSRSDISPLGVSVKSIIDPMSCTHMHNHFCWNLTENFNEGKADPHTFVDPKVATNNHYKRCHFDKLFPGADFCKHLLESPIEDNIMMGFRDKLVTSVGTALKKFHVGSNQID